MKNKLFTTTNFEEEIYRSMEKQLVSNQLDNNHGFKRLAQAADLLNKAASIFEQAGMTVVVEGITQTLQSLADDLNDIKPREHYEARAKKHAEQVRDRLAFLSGDTGWLQVNIKYLIPEMQFDGNPEKDAYNMFAYKGLTPDQFPMDV
jgi:hypothetical protein